MFGSKKEKRFEVVYTEGGINKISIIRDLETGVHYLETNNAGYAGGLTVLLDENGKPLIKKD